MKTALPSPPTSAPPGRIVRLPPRTGRPYGADWHDALGRAAVKALRVRVGDS